MRRVWPLLALAWLTGCLALTQHDGPWHCSTDADCTGTDTCRRLVGGNTVCGGADVCESSQDCGTGGYTSMWQCLGQKCTPVPCHADSDCGYYACQNGRCATSCTRDAQCRSGYACSSGSCGIPPCANDAECGSYRCQYGHCLNGCSSDTDCASGSLCTAGNCAPRKCTTGTPGQCDGFLCVNGLCATTCAGAGQCDRGLTCSTNRTCDCDSSPGACGGYACVDHACHTSCTSDSECDSSHHCVGDRCVGCVGTPLDCASQPGCSAQGCSVANVCMGGAIACGSFNHASGTCAGILGCMYDYSTIQCVGSATCAGQGYALCPTQFGCSPGTACSGTPTPCEQLSPSQCQVTDGCSLQ